MKKWNVHIVFAIQAETRKEAWNLARDFCFRKMRDLATVTAIETEPLDEDDWIAINEPIKARK